jgi:hypothetical protein
MARGFSTPRAFGWSSRGQALFLGPIAPPVSPETCIPRSIALVFAPISALNLDFGGPIRPAL